MIKLGVGCDVMGESGDGNCIGVGMCSVSVVLWCPMILGVAGALFTFGHIVVSGHTGRIVILSSLS